MGRRPRFLTASRRRPYSGIEDITEVTTSAKVGGRFVALDSCAILVLLHHTNVSGHLYGSRLIEQSWLFVDFFFVLSGFVVSHAYHGKISGLRDGLGFLTKRLSRLWPLQLFL